ncbi:MAG: hypothetical protein RJB60_1573 [Pseudomonadota bacterium]|jgi:uncharacterized membrane protein YfcA
MQMSLHKWGTHVLADPRVAGFAVINLSKLPTHIGLGLFSWETLKVSAIMLPLVPLGVWIGMRVLKYIPEKPFYWVATLALGLSGHKLAFDAWVG